jgi:hypothetical protein
MAQVGGPGSGDPFDPHDLGDVRARIVDPVVSALIRPAELRRVELGWRPRTHDQSAGWALSRDQENRELWVLVEASDATWQAQLWALEAAESLRTMGDVAFFLADRLEDWVCERVYWGEQVIAEVSIPERRGH